MSGQAATAPDLTRTVWQLQRTLLNNDDRFVPDNPGNYTVQFMVPIYASERAVAAGLSGC